MKQFNLVYIRSDGTIYKEPILCESEYFVFTYSDWLKVQKNLIHLGEIQYMSSIYLGEFESIEMASMYLKETDENLVFFVLGEEV